MPEIWKPIKGFESFYEVSNLGQIRRIGSVKNKTLRIIRKYYYADLNNRGQRKNCRVSRLVAKTFLENPNGYRQVNHINGDKLDNTVENLEWCNSSMNLKHAFSIGLKKPTRGEACGASKLKTKEIIEIRKLRKDGMLLKDIAKKFKVGYSTVTHICLGTRWGWLK